VVRALEVFRATGRPLSEQRQEGLTPLTGVSTLIVGLDLARDELRRRITERTREMFERGLISEVRALHARGFRETLRPLRAIGYRQAADVLAGRLPEAEAQRAIVTETMQYAKRQRTWFRHQAEVLWFDSAEGARAAVHDWLGDSR
jgi:tRNA dimethylallyltransferase